MDRFLIAPYDKESGLQTDVRPFLIPDQAFSSLENAYVFRGRVRKRFGSRWLGDTQQLTRLRMAQGTLAAPTSPVPTGSGSLGQMFSVADVLFTVNNGAAGNHTLLVANGSATTATFNNSTGAFVFAGVKDSLGVAVPLGTTIYFYPALPVMGLITYEQVPGNDDITVAFDTKFSYLYNGGWDRITGEVTPGASVWTGSNSQFFWGASYSGVDASSRVLYVTNFNRNEPNHMRFLVGSSWDNFYPIVSQTTSGATLNIYIATALILIPFKNTLVAFNIWESQDSGAGSTLVQYPNRARWAAFNTDPHNATAWRQDIPGKGSGLDCPTNESIQSVEYVKDRLIVYFEQSTWEFIYTSNKIYPFAWQQINAELGAQSPYSVIPFDKFALAIGNSGIHACNGTNVERIDNNIPDEVWEISNVQSVRVYGIRDYFVEQVYWSFPNTTATETMPYPKQVLVYNYKTGTWAINDDSITAFGYFQPTTGVTWDSEQVTWDSDITWDDGEATALFKNVVAGNQEGWTFLIDAEEPTNAPALQITDLTVAANIVTITAIDNNLEVGDFVYLEGIMGTGNLNLLNNIIYKITLAPTQNTFQVIYQPITVIAGTYSGGGTIRRMSQINIDTKQYNFYLKDGRNFAINNIDFQVDATSVGQIQVDYYVSTNEDSMLAASSSVTGSGALLGNGTLETFPYVDIPFEANSTRLVHPVYIQAQGEFISLNLSLNDVQMMTVIPVQNADGSFNYTGPAFVDFQLHSICFFAQPTTTRMR